MAKKRVYLGKDKKKKGVYLSQESLSRHISVIGNTGSGKTIILKCIAEGVATFKQGIPSIIIDIEGDLSSLILRKKYSKMMNSDEKTIWKKFHRKAEIRIFTPMSSAGIPLSINPIKYLKGLEKVKDEMERIQYIDFVAGNILTIFRVKESEKKYPLYKRELYYAMNETYTNPNLTLELIVGSIKDKKVRNALKKELILLDFGVNTIIFSDKHSYGMEDLITPSFKEKGKVPINIFNLKSVANPVDRHKFILDISTMVYHFMITNISRKVMFVLDEAREYVPPHPYTPPPKKVIESIFKRGRKSNVICMLATQNAKDVDYKIFGQGGTKIIGQIMDDADIEVVKGIIKGVKGYKRVLSRLTLLRTTNMYIFSPENFKTIKKVSLRELCTIHKKISNDVIRKKQQISDFKDYIDMKKKPVYSLSVYCEKCSMILKDIVCEECGHINSF